MSCKPCKLFFLYHDFTSNVKTNVLLQALSGLLRRVHVPKACTTALPTALQCSALQEQPESNRADRQGAKGALGALVRGELVMLFST